MHFTFCPQCGTKLKSIPFGDDGRVPWCENCDKPLFDIFPVVTLTLVADAEGEVALLRPKYMSERFYNFVSGYVLPGERAEECALREVAEELGIAAREPRYLCSQWEAEQGILLLGFLARAEKGEFALSEEIRDALWLPAREALAKVYPEGNLAHTLLREYLALAAEEGGERIREGYE